jgi:putative Holliday junction resolvase
MTNSLIGLDVGRARIGVAIVADGVSIPRTSPTLLNDDKFMDSIVSLANEKSTNTIVVGLPRNMSGEETQQTKYVREFAKQLLKLELPIVFQDEALTSEAAEQHLGRENKAYSKADVDSLAAMTILQDYLTNQGVKI